ncbi:hypothetical protein KUCAC02_006206 [Chaenocephalus aceratus]|nr:hypothetical protein KUCAC02_006206 [Chaenocephalus aceratus]
MASGWDGQSQKTEAPVHPKRDRSVRCPAANGTPVNRIPIMAKQVLDLYMLYKLVTEKGGLVEVINKKIWREITKGLNLPTSITSAAFTLRTQYMKYLYPFECERRGLSSPGELQGCHRQQQTLKAGVRVTAAASSASPPPEHRAAHPLSSQDAPGQPGRAQRHARLPGTRMKKGRRHEAVDVETGPPAPLHAGGPPLHGSGPRAHQVSGLARAATLEQLREKLEPGGGGGSGEEDGPGAWRRSSSASCSKPSNTTCWPWPLRCPSNMRLGNPNITAREEKQQDMSLSISTNGNASITVSVEVNGTIYSGTLFAQKSGLTPPMSAPPAGPSSSFSIPQTLSPASSSSSKGPSSAEAPPNASP